MAGQPKPIAPGDPVTAAEVIEFLSEPMTFAPVHKLRRVRCLACSEMIGSRPFSIHQLVDTTADSCSCGGLTGTIFLVCAAHGTLDDDSFMQLALDRAGRHHGGIR